MSSHASSILRRIGLALGAALVAGGVSLFVVIHEQSRSFATTDVRFAMWLWTNPGEQEEPFIVPMTSYAAVGLCVSGAAVLGYSVLRARHSTG